MGKTKKKTHGGAIPLKKSDLLERGRAIKRKALNRAKDRESLESIKEYVYDDKNHF
jgi:hypothetical protein